MDFIEITLTPRQEQIARWAIRPMARFFCDLLKEGAIDDIPPIPELHGYVIKIPIVRLTVVDLLGRLEDDYPNTLDLESEIDREWLRESSDLAQRIRMMDFLVPPDSKNTENNDP